MPNKRSDFLHALITSFNNTFFLSLLLLSLSGKTLAGIGVTHFYLPFANAVITLLASLALYAIFSKKRYFRIYSKKFFKPLIVVSIITGFLSYYMATNYIATFIISIIITSLTIKNIKIFAKKLAILLDVNKIASTQDLVEFFDFFINLILTFTVINLSLYVAHITMKAPVSFGFTQSYTSVIDALYFTVITMTTVGYGEIVPQTELAKLVIAFQSLVSYIMFGLMIGIISRGIDFKKKR